jgi:hypothetical protein
MVRIDSEGGQDEAQPCEHANEDSEESAGRRSMIRNRLNWPQLYVRHAAAVPR